MYSFWPVHSVSSALLSDLLFDRRPTQSQPASAIVRPDQGRARVINGHETGIL